MADQAPKKKALFVWGGWDGHTPKASTEKIAPMVESAGAGGDAGGETGGETGGYEVTISDTLDCYLDADLLAAQDVIVQCWTMGQISNEQWAGLNAAVAAGTGFAGWHGGIIDSFRQNTDYQFMTGGQWVAHPGNDRPSYTVRTIEPDHPITHGIDAFDLDATEQYYVHVDPGVHVLMTSTVNHGLGDITKYPVGVEMPFAWTRTWGRGKVFVACWGHTAKDFDVPEAAEIVKRGIVWASR